MCSSFKHLKSSPKVNIRKYKAAWHLLYIFVSRTQLQKTEHLLFSCSRILAFIMSFASLASHMLSRSSHMMKGLKTTWTTSRMSEWAVMKPESIASFCTMPVFRSSRTTELFFQLVLLVAPKELGMEQGALCFRSGLECTRACACVCFLECRCENDKARNCALLSNKLLKV